jgi:hypothetical protein
MSFVVRDTSPERPSRNETHWRCSKEQISRKPKQTGQPMGNQHLLCALQSVTLSAGEVSQAAYLDRSQSTDWKQVISPSISEVRHRDLMTWQTSVT